MSLEIINSRLQQRPLAPGANKSNYLMQLVLYVIDLVKSDMLCDNCTTNTLRMGACIAILSVN